MYTLSEDDFDKLFEEMPVSTVTANNLVGSKIENETEDSQEEEKKQTKEQQKQDLLNEDVLDSIFNSLESEEDKTDTGKKSSKEKETTLETHDSAEGDDYIKSIVDHLIDKEIFYDFEGREEFEYSDENFSKLLQEQVQSKSKEAFESLVESTGTIGKAIIDYVQKGGDPDEIIDLFKEQKRIETVELKSEDDKINFVRDYYTNVLKFKEAKTKKIIDAFILDDELDKEVEDIKESYKAKHDKDVEELQKQQQQYVEEQEKAEQAFAQNITNTLRNRTDLTDKEKSKLAESILYYNEALPDGSKVNKFYMKFAEVQKNMDLYLDLVQFVTDKEGYLNKIKKEVTNNVTKDTWTLIKRNNSTSSKTGSGSVTKKKESDVSDFKFFTS